MAYKTKVKYNRKKNAKSRFAKRLKKLRSKRGKKRWSRSARGKNNLKGKVKKVLGVFAGIAFIGIFIGVIFVMSVVGKYSNELPNPDEPFERGQDLTSYVYDRNGKELYKIHGDENREIVQIEEVPLEVQWAFLAAEDIDFYKHKGVDMGGIVKAGMYEVFKVGSPRGGSTITQQMIKNTVLTTERTYERKIKEIILSLRIEQKYDKKEVLQLYLNEIGFGGNTYGIKTAARVYFGKEVKDLTLGEAALLAGLPQAPGLYSPLFAADVNSAMDLSEGRRNYVLDQMQQKMDTINSYARQYNDYEGEEEFLTDEKILQAREQKLVYKSSDINIEAPHFVFYVEDELQKGAYNNGKPFTLAEIERGGLRITTSLDLDMQHMAEETIQQYRFGNRPWYYNNPFNTTMDYYGANNAALVTIDPKSGQVLAMVGSANYWDEPKPEGCTLGLDCKFEPKVNVAVSPRQPGSSIKPMVYYTGFESGQLYPSFPFLDADIPFANGYDPKNNSGKYYNSIVTLRRALEESLNIPAVEAIEIIGVTNFLNTLEKLGYSTFSSPENYGDAIALGAGDVKLLEHTNAYGVFAAGGVYHKPSPILKIKDKEGNVLYEYEKDESRKGVRVADEKATYLINDVAKNYHYNPPAGWDTAGKTGTTDNNKNVWYMGYTTEFVTGVWVGNNDNSQMTRGAYGLTIPNPIWQTYTEKIMGRFTPTKFQRPGGIVSASTCIDSGLLANDDCKAITDLFIQDKMPEKDSAKVETYRVCTDQKNRLAREIDEQLGKAMDLKVRYIEAPKPEWQKVWDKYVNKAEIPTEYCNKDRSPTEGDKPWVVISEPADGTLVNQGESVRIEATGYSEEHSIAKMEVYLDDTYLTQASNNPFVANITIPNSTSNGTHSLKVKVYDESNRTGSASVSIIVGDTVEITEPMDGATLEMSPMFVYAKQTGSSEVTTARLNINGDESTQVEMSDEGDGVFSASWTPTSTGNYTFEVVLFLSGGGTISSDTVSVTIVEETIEPTSLGMNGEWWRN